MPNKKTFIKSQALPMQMITVKETGLEGKVNKNNLAKDVYSEGCLTFFLKAKLLIAAGASIALISVGCGVGDYISKIGDAARMQAEVQRYDAIRAVTEHYGEKLSPAELQKYLSDLGLVPSR